MWNAKLFVRVEVSSIPSYGTADAEFLFLLYRWQLRSGSLQYRRAAKSPQVAVTSNNEPMALSVL